MEEIKEKDPRTLREKFTDNTNWLTAGFAALMYIVMGIMNYENGQLSLNDFSNYTWLDWLLWSIITFVPAILSVTISGAFEKEGIKDGEKVIENEKLNYERFLYVDVTKVVRSKAEYLSSNRNKKLAKKFIIALITSFVSTQLILGFTYDKLAKIIINISMWLYFGFQAYGNGNTYTKQELKEWYIIETQKLKLQKETEDKLEAERIKKQTEREEQEKIKAKQAEMSNKFPLTDTKVYDTDTHELGEILGLKVVKYNLSLPNTEIKVKQLANSDIELSLPESISKFKKVVKNNVD